MQSTWFIEHVGLISAQAGRAASRSHCFSEENFMLVGSTGKFASSPERLAVWTVSTDPLPGPWYGQNRV